MDVLMVCVGSRGDVQPFTVLAEALRQAGAPSTHDQSAMHFGCCPSPAGPAATGISSVVAAHPEFEDFVTAAGATFACIPASLPEALKHSNAGRNLRDKSGNTGLQGALDFFGGLSKAWLDATLELIRLHRPRILLLTIMPLITGGFLLKDVLAQELSQLHEQQQRQPQHSSTRSGEQKAAGATAGSGTQSAFPQLVVVHTSPARPTAAFLPPSLSGALGFSAPLGLFNRLLWWLNGSLAHKLLFAPLAARTATRFRLGQSMSFLEYDRLHKPLTLCCYCQAFVPKPPDWPCHWHVVGPWLPAGGFSTSTSSGSACPADSAQAADSAAAAAKLPEVLVQHIQAARAGGLPVLYLGLGSMLSCMFDDTTEAERMLTVLARAVELLQAGGQPCCAIIQSSTELQPSFGSSRVLQVDLGVDCPASQATAGNSSTCRNSAGSAAVATVLWLRHAVPHTVLLPLMDLVVHHGGMGTTHSALAAGIPSLVMPVALTADQPFWGCVLRQRGVGSVTRQPATKITATQLAEQLAGMLRQRLQYKVAAMQLAEEMAASGGLAVAVQLLQQML